MINFSLSKKIIILLMILFFPFSIKSATIIETGDVSVSARVIDPNAPTVTNNPISPGFVNLFLPKIGVSFKGEAYPNGKVFLLKNGKEVASVFADSVGYFNLVLDENYENTILYTLYAEDVLGNRSILINYPVVLYNGYITELSNIRFPPIILVNKNNFQRGEFITFSGYAFANKNLELNLSNTKDNKIYTLSSSGNGFFSITLPLNNNFEDDYYKASIKYINDSRLSKILYFNLGKKEIIQENISIKGDCNKDRKINLIDFSILAFWYKKDNPPICADTNNDGIINLIDFSILAFYWTN